MKNLLLSLFLFNSLANIAVGADAPAAPARNDPKTEVEATMSAREPAALRLAKATGLAMSESSDPAALALAAVIRQDEGLKHGDQITREYRVRTQGALLRKALAIAKGPNVDSIFDHQWALFCVVAEQDDLCKDIKVFEKMAEHQSDNAIGWMTLYAINISRGNDAGAVGALERASKSKRVEWPHSAAVRLTQTFVNAVVDPDLFPMDRPTAIFNISTALTLPPYGPLLQGCGQTSSTSSDIRSAMCERIGHLLSAQGQTNADILAGLLILERLQNTQNHAGTSTKDQLAAHNASIKYLWSEAYHFPPRDTREIAALNRFLADTIQFGERKATANALRELGKSVSDFLPGAEKSSPK